MMLIFCPVKTLITMRSTTIFVYSFFFFFEKDENIHNSVTYNKQQ